MPDEFDLNNQPRAADAVAQIPTSASEVAVRTMASDLEAMGRSGGMVNPAAAQAVQVPVALHPEEAPAIATPTSGLLQVAPIEERFERPPSGFGKNILVTLAVILAIGGLFALGYFVIGN